MYSKVPPLTKHYRRTPDALCNLPVSIHPDYLSIQNSQALRNSLYQRLQDKLEGFEGHMLQHT